MVWNDGVVFGAPEPGVCATLWLAVVGHRADFGDVFEELLRQDGQLRSPNQSIFIYQHTRSLFAGEAHLERGAMMNMLIYLPLAVNMFVCASVVSK